MFIIYIVDLHTCGYKIHRTNMTYITTQTTPKNSPGEPKPAIPTWPVGFSVSGPPA